jgi:hypothetical protein
MADVDMADAPPAVSNKNKSAKAGPSTDALADGTKRFEVKKVIAMP